MKLSTTLTILIAALILLIGLLPTPVSSGAVEDGPWAITHVRLFDGQELIEDATVLIEGSRVQAAGTEVDIPSGTTVVDGAGHTLLPGLIDAHTHSFGAARSDALRFGVTAVLDMFSSPQELPAARELRENPDHHASADLFSAGILATAAGGHGTQYGLPVPTLSGPDEADNWVAERLTEGSDYIKIVIDSGQAYERDMPTLDQATVTALVEAAHARETLALAHAVTEEEAFIALRAGVDGLVHLFHDRPASEAFISMAIEQEIFVVPTGIVMAGMTGAADSTALADNPDLADRLSGEQLQTLTRPGWAPQLRNRTMPALMHNIAALHEAGIPLLVGSDAPNPGTAHGISVHQEMALLVEAGLVPLDALRAATWIPSRHFDLEGRGCLKPGCRADMLLVDGRPDEDIHSSLAIARVWKNGREVPIRLDPDGGGRPARSTTNLLEATELDYWTAAADSFQGGNSSARLVDEENNGNNGNIHVQGQLAEGAFSPYAGVMWMPGDFPMQATDLSDRQRLVIRITGNEGPWQLMIFSGQGAPGMPLMKDFVDQPDGAIIDLDIARADGIDLRHIQAIGIFAVGESRNFEFAISEARLE